MAWGQAKRGFISDAGTGGDNTQASWEALVGTNGVYCTTIVIGNTDAGDHAITLSLGSILVLDCEIPGNSAMEIPIFGMIDYVTYSHGGASQNVRFTIWYK